jgi:hypothetical protein
LSAPPARVGGTLRADVVQVLARHLKNLPVLRRGDRDARQWEYPRSFFARCRWLLVTGVLLVIPAATWW